MLTAATPHKQVQSATATSTSFPPVEMTRERFDSIMEGMQLEVNDRVQKLRQRAKLHVASLRLRFDLELGRFPKEVRALTVREFHDKYGGDAARFFQQTRGGRGVAMAVATAVGASARKRTNASARTPAGSRTPAGNKTPSAAAQMDRRLHQVASQSRSISKKTPTSTAKHLRKAVASSTTSTTTVPQTPLILDPRLPSTPGAMSTARRPRMPARFESIMSVRGSPLVNPVHAASASTSARIRASSVIAVELGRDTDSGNVRDLLINVDGDDAEEGVDVDAAGDLDNLDTPAKKQVLMQLEALQSKLQSLVAKVKK